MQIPEDLPVIVQIFMQDGLGIECRNMFALIFKI